MIEGPWTQGKVRRDNILPIALGGRVAADKHVAHSVSCG